MKHLHQIIKIAIIIDDEIKKNIIPFIFLKNNLKDIFNIFINLCINSDIGISSNKDI